MAIIYLDVDDEITSAASRIRRAEDPDVVIVLPAGSRIATSRINFRLLAREASTRSRRLAIVAPEASARALAASAGLPVFASVAEYEGAGGPQDEATEDGSPRSASYPASAAGSRPPALDGAALQADRAGRPAAHAHPAAPARPAATPGPASPPAPGDAARQGAGRRDAAPARGAIGASTGLSAGSSAALGRRRRWPLVVGLLLIGGIVVGTGAAVGYVLLPTATVTLRLVAEPVGPVFFTGVADPAAVAPDAASGTIPATRIAIPLSASGTFKATGTRVEASAATGQARWTNCDPTRAYTIPQGTLARTVAGIAFRTREAVFLPVAILDPPRITCQNRVVEVRAVREGPAGNVPAGTITVVPGEYNSVVIKVTNPAATTGGAREEFPQVAEKDVSAAIATLTRQLDAQLATVAAAPPGLPAGSIAYEATARRGEVVPSEPAADLVGREVETFELTLTAEGTVVAADPAPLEAIGAQRVTAEVAAGMELRDGSVAVVVGPGVVSGETVRYPVTARAEAVRGIGADEVRALVKGRTPAAAKELLAPYGSVEVASWPDWASSITTIDARLTVVVEGVPASGATPAPVATTVPTAAPPSGPGVTATPAASAATAAP